MGRHSRDDRAGVWGYHCPVRLTRAQSRIALVGATVAILAIGAIWFFAAPGAPAEPGKTTMPSSVPQNLTRVETERPATLTETLRTSPSPARATNESAPPEPPKLAYTYEFSGTIPTAPATDVPVPVFERINTEWATALAGKFGIADVPPYISGREYIFVGGARTGLLRIDGRTGAYRFERLLPGATGPTIRSTASAAAVARAFLAGIDELPTPADAPATYQRTSDPGVFFVEYHRAWDPLPIIDVTGMLGRTLEASTENRPKDADVVRTSDRTDGFMRQNDFNTLTVRVDGSGRVLSVESSLRPIRETLPARKLLSPDAALEKLREDGAVLGFTMPRDPTLTQEQVAALFPEGIAQGLATLRSADLVFAERGTGVRQDYLIPVYLFSGSAKLPSGATADVVVAAPALADDSLPPA